MVKTKKEEIETERENDEIKKEEIDTNMTLLVKSLLDEDEFELFKRIVESRGNLMLEE